VIQHKVIFGGLVRRAAGTSEMLMALPSGATLGTLLRELSARLGPEFAGYLLSNGELSPHALVTIDGRYARELGGLEATLAREGLGQVEIVLLGPPVMGG
jgi:molybdopterin converting factor small subunit